MIWLIDVDMFTVPTAHIIERSITALRTLPQGKSFQSTTREGALSYWLFRRKHLSSIEPDGEQSVQHNSAITSSNTRTAGATYHLDT